MLKSLFKRAASESGDVLPAEAVTVERLPPPAINPAIRPDANGNRIRVPNGFTGNLNIEGTGNYLDIDEAENLGYLQIHLGGNAHAAIGSGCALPRTNIYICAGGCVQIGERTTAAGYLGLFVNNPGQIVIGPDCMMSGDNTLTIAAPHLNIDPTSRVSVNTTHSDLVDDILVGEHVWLGSQARIHKGARIGAGSLIEARSNVFGSIAAACVAGGTPARALHGGVRWVRERD